MGVMAYLERYMVEAEERGNPFIINLLEKQHSRLRLVFDRHVVSNFIFSVLFSLHFDGILRRLSNYRASNEQSFPAKSAEVLFTSLSISLHTVLESRPNWLALVIWRYERTSMLLTKK